MIFSVQLFIWLYFSVLVQGNIWPCENDEFCTATHSHCFVDQGRCACDFGKVFSSNFDKCLFSVLYGDRCEDSSQCNLMPSGASCKEGTCQCQEGSTYVRGICRKLSLLNQPCDESTDCYFGYDRQSVVCKASKCSCADGYYERYNNICRQKSMALHEPCVVDTDCESIENDAKCENLKCNLVSNTNSTETKEIAVQTSFDKIDVKTSSGFSVINSSLPSVDESRTSASITSVTSKSNDTNLNNQYGGYCEKNSQQCSGLLHSSCVLNRCYCQLGYYHKNGRCMAELGEVADASENCEFEYNHETKICQCLKNYLYETNLRRCKKPIHFGLSCTSDSQCSPFGAAACSSIIPRRCQCSDIAVFDENKQLCLYRVGLYAPCERDEMCTIPNSYCSKQNNCICSTNFVDKDGKCVKGIGAKCSDNDECTIDNFECKKKEGDNGLKTCQCKKGFVHFKDECHQEANEINEDCVIDEQCKPLLASCIDKKCQCKEDQHLSLNACEEKKRIGDECSRSGQCYMPADPHSIECRNSICQCKIEYKSVNNICKMKSKRNSSGRPSALKIVTFLLIGSAFAITTAAIKQAFY